VAAMTRRPRSCSLSAAFTRCSHWQTSGAAFYGLHLMFDKHYEQQLELIDTLAESVQLLGGVALATAHDVVQETRLARATSSSANWWLRTSSCSPRRVRWRARPRSTATTAPMT
jgi:DNA-binding ferritin-like protein